MCEGIADEKTGVAFIFDLVGGFLCDFVAMDGRPSLQHFESTPGPTP